MCTAQPLNAKKSIDHHWDLSANNKNGITTIMWLQASESAPRTHHGGMMFSTRPRNATTRRTTAKLHTQDNWTKCHHANQEFGTNVLQMWRPMVCIARPHCANIAMIVAGTSSQTRQNTMSTKLVCKGPPEILVVWCVFITEVHRATCSCFNTSATTGSVTEKARG